MINIGNTEEVIEDIKEQTILTQKIDQLTQLASFYDQKEQLSLEETLEINNIRRQIVDTIYLLLGDDRRSNPRFQKKTQALLSNQELKTEDLVQNMLSTLEEQKSKLEKRERQKLEIELISKLEGLKTELGAQRYHKIRAIILHNEELVNSILHFEIAIQIIGPAKLASRLVGLGLTPLMSIKLAGALSFTVRPATQFYFSIKRGDKKGSKVMRMPVFSDVYAFGNFLMSDHENTSDIYALVKMCMDEEDSIDDFKNNKKFCDQYIQKNKKRIAQLGGNIKSTAGKTWMNTVKSLELYINVIGKMYFELRNPYIPMTEYEKLRRAQIEHYRDSNGKDTTDATSTEEDKVQQDGKRKKLWEKIHQERLLIKEQPEVFHPENILKEIQLQASKINIKQRSKVARDLLKKYLKRLQNLNKKI